MDSAPSLLAAGTLVGGRYQVERMLGRGGMGAVYAALDTRLDLTIALKQLHRLDAPLLPAFEREAKLPAGLRHPVLPVVSDYFVDDLGRFLVMHYIPGDTLHDRLARCAAPLSVIETLAWADDLLDALIYLHSRTPPVIHRDIKPLNLKLTPSGAIYLLDFGLAKGALDTPSGAVALPSVYGYSVGYAPPEQIEHRGTDARSDLFALAATLYHALAAVPPESGIARRRARLDNQPDPLVPLAMVSPAVPADVSRVIMQALELDPHNRPASAAEFRLMLHDAAHIAERAAATTVALPAEEMIVTSDATTVTAHQSHERIIRYDAGERRRALSDLLTAFIDAVQTDRIRSALGRDTLAHLHRRERAVRERLDAPFTLVVMGDFKRGKSTLVNALLGADLVTTNVTPETLTINHIGYGPEVRIEAHLMDGGRVRLHPDELRAARLEPLLQQLPHPVSHLQIEAPIELLRGVNLVDMPGTGDVGWRFDQQVQAYLPRADAILYVVSALAPLSASEQAFLRLAVAPQEFPKLIFVVNMIDSIRKEADVDRVVGLLRQRIGGLFPHAAVYGISALDEFCRRLNRPRSSSRAATLEAAFARFRAALDESLLLNRDMIQIDRAVAQFNLLLDALTDAATRLLNAVERDQDQLRSAIAANEDQSSSLQRAIAEQRAAMRATIVAYGEQAAQWMEAFVDRIDREVIAGLHQHSLADVQRHLHFFLSDAFSGALRSCLDAHQPQIIAALEQTRTAIQTNVDTSVPADRLTSLTASVTFSPSLWNNLDTLRLLAAYAQTHLFGVMGRLMVQGALAAIDRQFDDPRQLASYQARLHNALPELRISLQREITGLYAGIADQIDTLIDQAYREDAAASLNAMRQAQAVHDEGAQRVAAVRDACAEALDVASEMRERLATFQRHAWTDPLSE
jgi:hypothetical protein